MVGERTAAGIEMQRQQATLLLTMHRRLMREHGVLANSILETLRAEYWPWWMKPKFRNNRATLQGFYRSRKMCGVRRPWMRRY